VETLTVSMGNLARPLEGLYGPWWKQGLDSMMSNIRRQLD